MRKTFIALLALTGVASADITEGLQWAEVIGDCQLSQFLCPSWKNPGRVDFFSSPCKKGINKSGNYKIFEPHRKGNSRTPKNLAPNGSLSGNCFLSEQGTLVPHRLGFRD